MRDRIGRAVERALSFVAGVGLLVGMAGCKSENAGPGGDGAAANGPVTVTFLRHDNPTYRTADNAFFADYKATHPNVTIVDTTVDFETLGTMLNGSLKQDLFPYDLVLIPPSWVCGFTDNLSDVPADIITLSAAQATYFPAPLAGSTCGGKLKGLPVEYNLEYGGTVVNMDKWQAKFPGRMPGWSDWNSFIADAAALTEYDPPGDRNGQPKANGLDFDKDWPEPVRHVFLSQILQRGGNYWSASGDTFDFSTPQAHAALSEMVKWLAVDKVMYRSIVPEDNTRVPRRLAAGAMGYGWNDVAKPLAVMGYMGTWGVEAAKANLPPGVVWHYDFFTLPPMVGTEHKFVQNSGWAFAVPKTSQNQKAAWDIARSLALSPEAMQKWSSVTGALPALRANATPAAVQGNPILARVAPLLERGQWAGYVPVAAFDTAHAAIVTNFFAAATGAKTVDQALIDMQQTANNAIMAAKK